jgi:hypothetical protein
VNNVAIVLCFGNSKSVVSLEAVLSLKFLVFIVAKIDIFFLSRFSVKFN